MDMCSEEVLKHRDKEVEERVLMLKAYHAVDVKSIDQSINEAIYLSIYLSIYLGVRQNSGSQVNIAHLPVL